MILNFIKTGTGEEAQRELSGQVTQIGSYSYHVADFAVDGNEHTCSIVCQPCNGSTGNGWWRYDFGAVTTVEEVQLLTCSDQISEY